MDQIAFLVRLVVDHLVNIVRAVKNSVINCDIVKAEQGLTVPVTEAVLIAVFRHGIIIEIVISVTDTKGGFVGLDGFDRSVVIDRSVSDRCFCAVKTDKRRFVGDKHDRQYHSGDNASDDNRFCCPLPY